MRRTSLSLILALAMVAGACGSESGPSVATLDQMRVVKVSGDQTSPVPSAPSMTIYATAGASLQALPGDGYTPEPLVARVVVDGGSMGIMSGGPIIPKGTETHWHIEEGGGKLFGGTRLTDDTAHVVNRWAPGIKAGTYRATAGRIVGTEIVTDAEWELVVQPGPVTDVQWKGAGGGTVCPGDTIDLREYVVYLYDAHRNNIDPDVGLDDLAAAIRWQWEERVSNSQAVGPSGAGMQVPVLDPEAHGFRLLNHVHVRPDGTRVTVPYYSIGVRVWVGDRDTGWAAGPEIRPAECPR